MTTLLSPVCSGRVVVFGDPYGTQRHASAAALVSQIVTPGAACDHREGRPGHGRDNGVARVRPRRSAAEVAAYLGCVVAAKLCCVFGEPVGERDASGGRTFGGD